ncbi:MAG: 2-hydroxy-3-oxopropionate reductase [Pseudomonadota bacterium]|nr:MAG: 2-hydroxy-3-oxopropionate reductase [Pseudomonadota bacterium]
MTEQIGFIGLGIMGKPMALNLLKAGYPLHVYARRAEQTQPLLAEGATAHDSAQAVATHSDVVILMVSDTPDVEEVILGAQGVLAGARAGSVVVDMSTIAPANTRALAKRLAEQDVAMLDAPVSGGEAGAIAGTLSIMVGGEAAVFARLKPVFEVLGKNIVHVGGNGAGQVTKMCNQMVVAQTIAAVGEALLLAERCGVGPAKVRAALLGGFASSRVLEAHGQRMLEDNFTPGFRARLHQKDLRIALESARDVGVTVPGTAAAAQLLGTLVERGDGDLDHAAMITVLREMADKPGDQ